MKAVLQVWFGSTRHPAQWACPGTCKLDFTFHKKHLKRTTWSCICSCCTCQVLFTQIELKVHIMSKMGGWAWRCGGKMQYCFHFHPLTPSPLPTSWSTLAPSIHLKLGILYQLLAFGHIYKGELFWEYVMACFFFIRTFTRMASSLCPPLHPPLCPLSCSNPFTLQELFLPMNKYTSHRGWLSFQFEM